MALVLAVCLLGGAVSAAHAGAPQRLEPKQDGRLPERIVTLAPSLTATVLALGRGEALVGVSRYDEAPQVARLPRVGGLVDPSVEAIVALRPDLVLLQAAPGNKRLVELLASLDVPVLELSLHTIAETVQSMLAVGAAIGRPQQARELVDTLETTRRRIRAQTRGRKAPRVLFVVGYEPLVVAGPGSFAHELLLDAGGRNAAEGARSAWVVYPLERAVTVRPDVVVDAAHAKGGRDKVKALPGLSSARWVEPPSDALLQPGPALASGLEELAVLLHGPAAAGGDARLGKESPDATREPERESSVPRRDAGHGSGR